MAATKTLVTRDALDASDPDRAEFRLHVHEIRARMAAVVSATTDAANLIIGNMEQMVGHGASAPGDRAMDVMSACAFHDIVGQHMARAKELLEMIERLGEGSATATPDLWREADRLREKRTKRLVSGPASLPGEALDQAAVDKLFD